jgi:hypothetical protein
MALSLKETRRPNITATYYVPYGVKKYSWTKKMSFKKSHYKLPDPKKRCVNIAITRVPDSYVRDAMRQCTMSVGLTSVSTYGPLMNYIVW